MWKLLISNTTSRYYTLMNAKTYNGLPRETIISKRWLRCTCDAQWCHYFARFKHEILCIIGLPYNSTHHKPLHRTSLYNSWNLHIIMIDLPQKPSTWKLQHINHSSTTSQQAIDCHPNHGFGCKRMSHYTHPIMKCLETKLKLHVTKIKNNFKQINIITTQYAHSIQIHKHRLENQ